MQAILGGWDLSPGSYHGRPQLVHKAVQAPQDGAEVRPQLRAARCRFCPVCGHNTSPVSPGQRGGGPHILMGRGAKPCHMGRGGRG